MKVEDPRATAGAFAHGGQADFAHATASDQQGAFVRLGGEHALKGGVFLIGDQARVELGKVGGFNEDHAVVV